VVEKDYSQKKYVFSFRGGGFWWRVIMRGVYRNLRLRLI
jgi:hypothetical protein